VRPDRNAHAERFASKRWKSCSSAFRPACGSTKQRSAASDNEFREAMQNSRTPVEMAEEVRTKNSSAAESGKNGGPNKRCVLPRTGCGSRFRAAQGRALSRRKVEGFDIRENGGNAKALDRAAAYRGAHTWIPSGKFSLKSRRLLAKSSHRRSVRGFEQMRNQLAISIFSARLLGSTLGLREIISAALPEGATLRRARRGALTMRLGICA